MPRTGLKSYKARQPLAYYVMRLMFCFFLQQVKKWFWATCSVEQTLLGWIFITKSAQRWFARGWRVVYRWAWRAIVVWSGLDGDNGTKIIQITVALRVTLIFLIPYYSYPSKTWITQTNRFYWPHLRRPVYISLSGMGDWMQKMPYPWRLRVSHMITNWLAHEINPNYPLN